MNEFAEDDVQSCVVSVSTLRLYTTTGAALLLETEARACVCALYCAVLRCAAREARVLRCLHEDAHSLQVRCCR